MSGEHPGAKPSVFLAQILHDLHLWLNFFDLAKTLISSIPGVSQAGSEHFKHGSKNCEDLLLAAITKQTTKSTQQKQLEGCPLVSLC